MNKTNTCPICGNHISSDFCPHCLFDLSLSNNEKAVKQAKQFYPGGLVKVKKKTLKDNILEINDPIKLYHYIAGVFGTLSLIIYFVFDMDSSMIACLIPTFPSLTDFIVEM